MKILSLWQPWASLVAIGAKKYETRSWATDYRGPIAIHAAKTWDATLVRTCYSPHFRDALKAAGYHMGDGAFGDPLYGRRQMLLRFGLPFGKIVAVADLVECMVCSATKWPAGSSELSVDAVPMPERAFGDFTPGRYAWKLANVRRLDEPIPCRGCQGLRDLDPKVARLLDEHPSRA